MRKIPASLSALVLALLAAGCAAHSPKRLDCEGHLRPINAPARSAPASEPP